MTRMKIAALLIAAFAPASAIFAQPPASAASGSVASAFPVTEEEWRAHTGRRMFDRLRVRERMPELRAGAEAGDVNAMALLAIAYLDGDGVARDPAEARRWAERAAEANHVRAIRTLGAIYLHGAGVPRDVPRALTYLDRAYRAGSLLAATDIATILHRGEGGTPRDPVRALALFREAAAAGFPPAYGGVAAAYYNGEGIAQDYALAFQAAREGAVRDDGFSAFILATLYDIGQGVARDSERARGWLEIAATNGHDGAIRTLQWTPETVALVRRWGPYARLTNRRLRDGAHVYRYHWREPGRVLVMTYGNLDDLAELDANISWPEAAPAPTSDNPEWALRLIDGEVYEEMGGQLYRMVPGDGPVSRMRHARQPDGGLGAFRDGAALATVSRDEYDRLVRERQARVGSAAQQRPAQGQPAGDH